MKILFFSGKFGENFVYMLHLDFLLDLIKKKTDEERKKKPNGVNCFPFKKKHKQYEVLDT